MSRNGKDCNIYISEEEQEECKVISRNAREVMEDSKPPSISHGVRVMLARARMTMTGQIKNK